MSDRLTTDIPKDLDVLNRPITFPVSGLKAPNAIMKSAMTERLASYDEKDPSKRGIPSPELIRAYEEWGKGGFGLLVSGNTFSDYINLESRNNAIMVGDEPERFEGFKKMAAAAKAEGSIYVVQLSHAGRQVSYDINPNPVSASDVQLVKMSGRDVSKGFGKPTELTTDGIKEVVGNFAKAAAYAHKTGADGVQLHSAHGYLLAQFLAPSTNKRTDQYGGSLENRSRIHFEILEAIKKTVPDPKFSISIKINSTEFQEGGFTAEECRDVCARLEAAGIDWIELSGGTYEELAFTHKRDSTRKREAFFLEFADIIRSGIKNVPVYVTGGFRTSRAMIDAISHGSCQGVGLARPVCEEFDLPKKLLRGEVASARKTLIPNDDFRTGNAVCCAQIAQVGRGEKPTDTLVESELNPLLKELGLA